MPFSIGSCRVLNKVIALNNTHMAGAFVHFGSGGHLQAIHMEGVEELMKREPPKESDPADTFPHEWAELDDFKWAHIPAGSRGPLARTPFPVAV
ncbi:hypothetical protein QM042_02295 [Escherichia coli]|uniref:hypothetical protein n=1 Tax=Escherichia coli TaxID=562 RepID=UPI0039870E72